MGTLTLTFRPSELPAAVQPFVETSVGKLGSMQTTGEMSGDAPDQTLDVEIGEPVDGAVEAIIPLGYREIRAMLDPEKDCEAACKGIVLRTLNQHWKNALRREAGVTH